MPTITPDGRAGITADLVRRLVDRQFPQWSGLPVTPVPVDGWDNRTYRLGDTMTARLPTAAGYVPAVAKEHRWLPRLAPHLPVAIPPVLAEGEPGEGYPYPWSVRGWLPGETALPHRVEDLAGFAVAVGEFLVALQRCDATGGPLAGAHSFYRGTSPAYYDEETRRCLELLKARTDRFDIGLAEEVWAAALATTWEKDPVWFHGDVGSGNLLVTDGQLTAAIDFGTCGIGDPACDLVIAWHMFSGAARQAFRDTVAQDDGTWARARGWALWKAALVLSECIDTDPEKAADHARVIDEVLADHRRTTT
ncbi:aminoglycoside phosphotransferase family protein [Streptomyces sp. NPDC046939]|uniref:aminoglycoside phosphotransferase family protein n=1 Tax=Streptomyces sp. NPDC046939 TaxID=3155376 RepID=UPI0033E36864